MIRSKVQTQVCQTCGRIDTEAIVAHPEAPACTSCGALCVFGPKACSQCSAAASDCRVLSYVGCPKCRPESQLRGTVRKGPAARFLAQAALRLESETAKVAVTQPIFGAAGAAPRGVMPEDYHCVAHIVEEPGGIRNLTECEVPTEVYNKARYEDLISRYPNLSPGVGEHLECLEPFLDVSIAAGFSYGVEKAHILVMEGSLLGHLVGRSGSTFEKDRTQAIVEFAPLKNESHVRQFLGSSNWVRK